MLGNGAVITGVGLTVIVKVIGAPVQLTPPLVNVGVTVIVAVTGKKPVLIATNGAILPVPVAARPMLGVLLVHAYVTVPPVFGVVNVTAAVVAPLHKVWFATAFTTPVGLTVYVKVVGVPVQEAPARANVIV